jgi:CubicO group peptidase (beta-lactamase class C family)
MVLGLIVEKVSGESYFDYLREHVYVPAGMKDAGAFELDRVVPRLATGYSRSREEPRVWLNNLYVNVVKGGPAGGSYATAADLLHFANALTAGKLLRPESVLLLTEGKVDYGSKRYAYGFAEETVQGHRIFGHSGGHVGIADELTVYPDLGYTVVVLTNGDVEDFWDVQAFLKRQLVGSTPDGEAHTFTRRLLDTTIASGYEAGARALAAKPAALKVRDGVIEQWGYRLLWEGKTKQALEVFRLGAAASPDLSTVHLGLADASLRLGERQGAIEQLKKYLEMEPDDEEVRRKLEKLASR